MAAAVQLLTIHGYSHAPQATATAPPLRAAAPAPAKIKMTTIKDSVVKKESILVQRMKIANLRQTSGVGVENFIAELCEQSKLCKYSIKCTAPGCDTDVDYSDDMIKDYLVRGIADPEILSDLLEDPQSNSTLAQVVDFIAVKEQAKTKRRAMGESTNSTSSEARTNFILKRCWACGEAKHGRFNTVEVRRKYCKAWKIYCPKCNDKGHLPKQCGRCSHCGQFGHRKGNRSCPHF